MPLDPQARALIDSLTDGVPPVETLTPAEARAASEERRRRATQPTDNAELTMVDATIDRRDAPLRTRSYRPKTFLEQLPLIVFLHGGGWVLCDLESHDALCRTIATSCEALVLSIDYRLAPEHPFPSAIDDADFALEWAYESAADMGVDPTRLAVAGDSAGATLATVAARHWAGESRSPLRYQLLLYPITDCDFETDSYREFGGGEFYLTRSAMEYYWDHYLGSADRTHPDAAPLRALDLSGCPPSYIVTAECDPLRDEGEKYAERLRAAGVATTLDRVPGMFHGFFSLGSVLDAAAPAIERALGHLKQAIHAA